MSVRGRGIRIPSGVPDQTLGTPLGSTAGSLCVDRVRRRVADDPALVEVADGPARLAAIRSAVARAVREEGLLLAPDALAGTVREVADALAGLGPIQALLRDPEVTDVMVNGPDEVWVERSGRLERTSVRTVAPLAPPAARMVLTTAGRRLAGGWATAAAFDGTNLASLGTALAPLSAGELRRDRAPTPRCGPAR
jgi:hypothetical protein